MNLPQPQPSEYERVKIFSLVKDEDGSVSRVPMCLCELCRVNHFLCPRHSAAGEAEKVLDDFANYVDTLVCDGYIIKRLVKQYKELRQQGECDRG